MSNDVGDNVGCLGTMCLVPGLILAVIGAALLSAGLS
jgi:hypothetical protein